MSMAIHLSCSFLMNGAGTRSFFSKKERGTERIPEIRGTKLRSFLVPFSLTTESCENAIFLPQK